ncbi:MAG TPA: hypothetical protein VNT79_05265 [Phycisphaerae bacterium]|nr:hypothetical protein [Phycisphaerae bacterium]
MAALIKDRAPEIVRLLIAEGIGQHLFSYRFATAEIARWKNASATAEMTMAKKLDRFM